MLIIFFLYVIPLIAFYFYHDFFHNWRRRFFWLTMSYLGFYFIYGFVHAITCKLLNICFEIILAMYAIGMIWIILIGLPIVALITLAEKIDEYEKYE